MTKRLAPAFIELTQDALLKAFWYKASLHIFLRQHNLSDTTLAQWQPDQTKRDFVQRLWLELVKDERGQNAILGMARSLAEMNHFPDLERKEDSQLQIADAQEAVRRLRQAVLSINETIGDPNEIAGRRKAAQAELAARAAAKQSLATLAQRLTGITPQLGTQAGGYAFEKWFYALAKYFELDARPSYWAGNRQIDGAITIDGTTFLVETKFTNEPVGPADVDVFMAKIESKADNTMGLLVSLSGFNDGAKRAASKQRTPMLLVDHSHIFNLILRGEMTLPQVVSRVKRHASQTGSAHLPAEEF